VTAPGGRLSTPAVCRAFGLGPPAGRARRLRGGYLNRVWRLETARGAYAVKVLNPRYLDPERRRQYDATLELERLALEAGVPTAEPVAAAGGAWLVGLPFGLARVHRWVEGRPLDDRDVGPEHARQLGALLARVHGVGPRRDVRPEAVLREWTPAHWEEPARELPELAPLPALMDRVSAVVVAGRALLRHPVLTHGDVSAKNLLERPDGTVVLLDWDAAQPMEPCLEVAAAALNLAGHVRDEPRPDVLRAFLAGYREAGGRFEGGDRRVLAAFLDGMLGWVWLNYRRAVAGASTAERRDGRRTAARAVRQVRLTLDSLDAWADLLSRRTG
jgi:Ser/Thr protein kinase RdoA (MazF antagonist)